MFYYNEICWISYLNISVLLHYCNLNTITYELSIVKVGSSKELQVVS